MNIIGRTIANRYEIINKTGVGGMATVYVAKDKVLNRNVAVKVLKDEFTTDEEFVKRFNSEAQAAASLSHPNIVSIYDVGNEDNIYYIVMELVRGKTLKQIITEEGALPWKWSVNIAMQIASALETAHKNNIVHRDIKPHNIIITEDGVAKVTDFGIAKAVSNSTITAFGTTIGSVHYFSPEHARGGFTDEKSDIYSLGVVMYEMLTGRVPFDADTPVSVALKHMQEEPVEPKEINPNIPSSVNKIIMKALKKDPTLRYQTSTEMLQDLRACLKNPNGNFVEEKDYDETAKTQRINVSELEENKRVSKEDKNSDNKFIAFIKEHKKLSIFIGVILLFFIAFGGTMLFLGATNPKEVELPNITGMTAQEAEETLKKANLKYELEKEEYNKDVEEGKVISQEPPYQANFKVKEGSQVKVVISKGQEKTKVPKVVGMKQDEAVKALEEAKLKYEIVEEASKKVEEGYVISQETEADADAFAGDTVKIHVSTGTEKVTMVSVLDKSEEDAKTALKAIGITSINTVYEENSSKAKGVVLKQSVEPGSTVEKDSKITITVNNYEASNTINLVINVKSLTGGYTESTTNSSNVTNSLNTTNTTTTSQQTVNKKVDVSVSVGGTVVQTRTNIDKNQTDLSIQVDGKGTQTVTVNAGGAISTKTINFAGTEKTIKIP